MANIFDIPTQQNYVETHIPLPLEEMGRLASKWTDNYNAGKSLLGGLDKLAQKIEVSPLDEQRKQDWFQKNNKALNELAQKGVENPGLFTDSSFQNEIQQTINQAANDPELRILKSNNEEWIDYSKASSKGTGNDLHFGVERDSRSINGLKQSQRGEIFNPKITKYNNPYKSKAEIMGGISSSGNKTEKDYDYSKMEQTPDGNYNVWRKSTNEWVGVNATRVNEIADLSADIYGNTEDGKWEVQKILSEELGLGSKAYDFDYNKLQELSTQDKGFAQIFSGIKKRFKNDLVGVATKQIGGVSKNIQESRILAIPKDNDETIFETPGSKEIPGDNIEIPSFETNKGKAVMDAIGFNQNIDRENAENLSKLDSETLLRDYKLDVRLSPKKWNEQQQKVLNDVLTEYPDIAKEYKQTGYLSKSSQNIIMPMIKNVIGIKNKVMTAENTTLSLSNFDENYLKQLFQKDVSKINTVDDLSLIDNFYIINEDKKSLDKISYKDLMKKTDSDSDSEISIVGKMSPKNQLSKLYGKQMSDLVEPYSVNVNGTNVYIGGPQATKTKEKGYNNNENAKIKAHELINNIHNLRSDPFSPKEFEIDGDMIKAKFITNGNKNAWVLTNNNGKTISQNYDSAEDLIKDVLKK